MEAVPTVRLDGGEGAIDTARVDELRAGFRGDVLLPGGEGYDDARRVFNRMIDRRPALIARCAGAVDVVRAVDFARERRIPIAVRGGGHSVAGSCSCDGGVVIDLSRMKGLRIEPEAGRIRCEPGLTWGEVNRDLQAFGLGATGGYVSITGISGLTLGGGFGWLVRKHGLALDNLLSVDLVTADGRLRTVGPDRHEDLFWGLRGGGGSLGVVTSFEFRVHPVGTVLAGLLVYPIERAREVLRLFREHVPAAPDEMTWGVLLFHMPPNPELPAELHDAPVAAIAVCWAGPIEEGQRFLRPVREALEPMVDAVQPMPYATAQVSADGLWPPDHHGYWKSSFLTELADGAIDTMAEAFGRVPSPRTVVLVDHNGGGAIDRVGEEETAFGHRGWTYNFLISSGWADAADTRSNVDWTRALWDDMEAWRADAAYVNYTSDRGEELLEEAFPSKTRDRLANLKHRYDPDGLFRFAHHGE